jgi:cardiolipin synthase
MFVLIFIIALIYIINFFLTITVIFLERKNPTSTWAWILVLNLIPGIGFILYLTIAKNFTRKKLFKLNSQEEKIYFEFLEKQKEQIQKGTFEYYESAIHKYQDIIKVHLEGNHSFFTQDNTVEIFTDGHQKFEALFDSIKNAKKHIHILYYIIKGDTLGLKLINLLTQKAKEGIEVKLLFDALGGRTLKNSYLKPLIDAGGKVAIFFPSKIFFFNFKVNYRNHRKLAIIDGKTGFIGGYNVGNEYLGLNKKMGYWRDTHLKIEGSSVIEMQLRFILDWRSSSKIDIDNVLDYSSSFNFRGKTGIQIVSSGPDTPDEKIKSGFLKMINSAKKCIHLQTPYFVPDESIMDALKLAALSGVDIKIMLPDKPDHPFVYWASYWYAGELIKVGVKFYTYNNGFLHAKTLVVDNILSSVGTSNFDIRSFKLNFEINAFIYENKISRELSKAFEEDLKYCTEITRELYDERSLIIKFKESFSRLLSPLL